jgi:hypothetical protein
VCTITLQHIAHIGLLEAGRIIDSFLRAFKLLRQKKLRLQKTSSESKMAEGKIVNLQKGTFIAKRA